MYGAKILADSIGPSGRRLTTFEVTYPRFVHAELMTHREFSRNSASSRAIPVEKMISRILVDPVLPVWWGKNQSGMQAREELAGDDLETARRKWLAARDSALEYARELLRLDVHKQIVNRVLEPWMWITVIVSATQLSNFFALRCHPDAQPEIARAAYLMRDAHEASRPREVPLYGWHLPLVHDPEELRGEGFNGEEIAMISCGRCARVSYLTHDGKRDPHADLALATRLIDSGHMSPFEHAARALGVDERVGNFRGWMQLRKTIPGEHDFSSKRKA